jgi:hypothetical protein
MREILRREKWFVGALGISALLVAGGWVWAFVALRYTASPLALHFNADIGISQIGSLRNVSSIALISLVAVAADAIIGISLLERDRFLAWLTASAALLFSILIFIALAAIISFNT